MADIIKVETETIAGAVYLPATETSPWTVSFGLTAPSPELAETLLNSGAVTVEVTQEGVEPVSGTARVITGEEFLLVGRTDMQPVE